MKERTGNYFIEMWKFRHLTKFLVQREIEQRYRGSALGLFWIVLSSLLMLGIYTFVFNVIFVSRWPGIESSRVEVFAVILFAGLSMYSFASECWSRATSLISENVTYITKVVFPVELLPVVVVLSSLVQLIVNFTIVLSSYFFVFGMPKASMLSFIFIIIPFILLVLGITYIISFLSPFIRDLKMIIPFLLTALLYLSPVLYPVQNTPTSIRYLFDLNPLSFFFEKTRGALFFGEWPSPLSLALAWCLSLVVLAIGAYIFRRGARAFADVL